MVFELSYIILMENIGESFITASQGKIRDHMG